MRIKHISLTKSKTVGIITPDNRSRFKKITISASADLDEEDKPEESYKELSKFIESRFEYEKKC